MAIVKTPLQVDVLFYSYTTVHDSRLLIQTTAKCTPAYLRVSYAHYRMIVVKIKTSCLDFTADVVSPDPVPNTHTHTRT